MITASVCESGDPNSLITNHCEVCFTLSDRHEGMTWFFYFDIMRCDIEVSVKYDSVGLMWR